MLHFEKEILIQINETQNPMSTEPPNSQNPSHGMHNDLRYTLPKRPVFKREYASKLSWSDWQKNYISDLVMSRKSTWEVHFHNERERKRFSNEIIEMQSQQNTMKNKTKREVDRVKEEYARMLALSCVHRKYRFSKLDPFQEERDKLTKKNLEMFEESYKAHLRSRPRDESPKSAPGFGRERSFDNPPSNSQCVHHRSSDHLQTEAIPPRSSLPGDKMSGIKELSKLYPAFSKKKPAMNRNMDLSVKGASLQSKKISIRSKSSIPPTVSVMRQKEIQTEHDSVVSQQPARKPYHDLKSVYKQTKRERLWINPQDNMDQPMKEGNRSKPDQQMVQQDKSTGFISGFFRQQFKNHKQTHPVPPGRIRFIMQLQEASANLEPIPERPKKFLPEEMRSIKASRQFLDREVEKVLQAWSPSARRHEESHKLLEGRPRSVTVDRGKTLAAIMRDFRVYMEETRSEERVPSNYKERYLFPDME